MLHSNSRQCIPFGDLAVRGRSRTTAGQGAIQRADLQPTGSKTTEKHHKKFPMLRQYCSTIQVELGVFSCPYKQDTDKKVGIAVEADISP